MEGLAVLVLSRKEGESIQIGSDIKITVVEIDGNRIRLGFVAPADVRIFRQEVFERIQEGTANEDQ
jgi:carbon storage regulator